MSDSVSIADLKSGLLDVQLTRRRLFQRAALIGVALPATLSILSACADDDADEEEDVSAAETDDDETEAEPASDDETDVADEDPDEEDEPDEAPADGGQASVRAAFGFARG